MAPRALLPVLLLAGCSEAPAPPPPPPAPVQVAIPTAPAPAPGPDVSGLRLHGLLASGAILGFADGRQRLVPIGREALPGVTLVRIEPQAAVFAGAGGGEVRLGFEEQAPPAAQPHTAPAADDGLRYRLGLEARRTNGRVTGFTVRPGADLPALARAGIRPGDTILSVNGSRLDEERMLELPWQIDNSDRLVFEVERGGRRLRMTLDPR